MVQANFMSCFSSESSFRELDAALSVPPDREYRENLLPNWADSSKLWPQIAPDLKPL
jgi:hypothetical protein